ncbi:MAG: response regulator [Nitrospirae bacterium]|nr:response regulator [Nitrospirota bacterium]
MSKRAIICVDDEKTVLNTLKAQLKKHFSNNYRYEFAESADEAIELIEELVEEEVTILIIVSDWLMPGIKGDEFLVIVHKKYPQIVKVILTGQADEESIERLRRNVNLHRCLFKPWEEKDLLDTITSGIGISGIGI